MIRLARLATGIEGFDAMIQGGLPEGSSVLLQGPPGQEKLRFALTFLAEGLKSGGSGLVVISSQSPDSVLVELRDLGVNLDTVSKENRLRVVDWYSWSEEPVEDVEERGAVVRSSIDLTNLGVALSRGIAGLAGGQPRRAVIEILSPATNVYEVTQVYAFAQSAKKKFDRARFTSLVLVEKDMHPPSDLTTLHQPFDGVIEIERSRSGDRIVRKVGVLHLKETAPDPTFRILEVTEGGMKVVREASKPAAATSSASGVLESQDERARRLHLIMQIASERLKLNPSDADALFALAAAQATLDDAKGGVQSLDRLAALDPNYPGLWVLKTKLHARLGQTDLARQSRTRAQQGEPEAAAPSAGTVPCPMCEAPVPTDATSCENCGIKFAPTRTLEDELDDLGRAAIQEMVQEELGGKPRPSEPSEVPAKGEPRPAPKPLPKKGLTNGLALKRGGARRAGMTNGLRGRTNGLRGRTNGLTNGLGRTNGLTNGVGRTNGLTNGLGRTNGLTNGLGRTNGLTNGLGRTNGITNGLGRTNGLTNGLGGTRPAGFHSSGLRGMMRNAGWKLYLTPLVAVVLLLMPLFLVPEYQGPAYPIQIDGDFGDWASVSTEAMAPATGVNPNIDVVRFGVVENLGPLAFYVEVAGSALAGGGAAPGTMDAIRILVDIDGSPATGYRIDGFGADRMIDVSGYAGVVRTSTLWEFDSNRDTRDWNGWIKGTPTAAAASGSRIEVQAKWLPAGPPSTPILASVQTSSWDADADRGDFPISPSVGTLSVIATVGIPAILSGNDVPLLDLTLTAHGQTVSVNSLQVEIAGTAAPSSAVSLRVMDGGTVLGQTSPTSRDVTFSFPARSVGIGASTTLSVVGDFTATTGETFGVRLPSAHPFGFGASAVSLRESASARTVGYLGLVPPTPAVDGGFNEWSASLSDAPNDVAPRPNGEIDIVAYAATRDGPSTYLYTDVLGRIFLGTAVPQLPREVPPQGPPSPPDTDRDSVPDISDPMPLDFNNDGTVDAQTNGDYDADGILDYGVLGGTDYWLNTTLPLSFPAPYAGRFVTVYIGPTANPPVLGEDVLRIFLDVDNATFSGYSIGGIGADRLIETRGKDGRVTGAALLSFSGSFPGEWSWTPVSPVTVALGYHEVELSVPLAAAKVVVEAGDFWGAVDSTTAGPASAPQLSSFKSSAASQLLSVPWIQVGPEPAGTLVDGSSNSATTVYNHQRKAVRAGDVAGDTACDATNSDGCWYVVFYDQLLETAANTAPSTETITKGTKVAGTFPTDIQTSNDAYIRYQEANQAPTVNHTFVEQTTLQTTTSATYVDIPGASITSSYFTAGRKYLLVFTAQMHSQSGTRNAIIQAIHGTTAFSGSEFSFQTDDVASRYVYYWFTVWTAVSGEGVKLQYQSEQSGFIIGADQITMFKLDLGDLTQGTDWFFTEDATGDTIAGATWDGLASVTFTPSTASNWLVMTTMRGDPDSISTQYESRIARSGEAVETQPVTSWEGNDGTLDRYVQTLARVYSLGAASNTFAQESRCDKGCTYPRSYSAVFALNLNRFEDRTSAWTEAPISLSTTDFATQIQTATLTPTRAGDFWIVGQSAVDVDTTGNFHKFRLQVDNTDQPGTQTSDAYQLWNNWDNLDEVLTAVQTVENLGVSAHTFDVDASRQGSTANAEDRMLFAVSMVLTGYEMEVRYDWSGIASGSSEYVLKVEAHHTAGENFLVQALTPPATWNTRITVTKTADDNAAQTYTLTTAEFNAGAPSIRFLGASEGFDPVQSDLYLDYVVVSSNNYWDRIILMRSSDTSGSTWGAQVILASGRTGDSALVLARDSSEPSIAIDSVGFLHVAWVAASTAGDQTTLNLVRYTKATVAFPTQSELANGANWESVTNVDDASTGYMPTVSTDTSNNPHVAWSASKTSGTVYYKNKAGGTWRSTVSLGATSTGISVDVSPQNSYVSVTSLGLTSPWWNTAYPYRQRITVTTGSAAAPTGYTVATTVNHAALVTGGTSQADGDDVRVLYWTGSAWTELDRVLEAGSSWNSGSTSMRFKTQAAIGASSSDSNYYLYYGNSAATSPPANAANVYLFSDDFEAGNLNKWTIDSGSWAVATDQARTGTYALKHPGETSTERRIWANPALDVADVYMEAWWRFDNVGTMDLAQVLRKPSGVESWYETNLEGGAGWNIAKVISGTYTELNSNAGSPGSDTWTRIGTAIYGTGMRVFKDGSQINPGSGSFNVGSQVASGNVGLLKWNIGTNFAWWIDDVVVRKYVDPEPTTSLASEEAAVEARYQVCRDLSTSNCDAASEFTKWDGSAGFDSVAGGVDSGSYPSLATTWDSNGDLWVAYVKDVDATTRAIYARFLDYPSAGWQATTTVDSLSGTVFGLPSIGIDSSNDVHALYVATSTPQLYYNERSGGSWGTRAAVDTSSDKPSLMVRGPNDPTYGPTPGGLYWKTSTSETYFHIPEFETMALPIAGVTIVVFFLRRRGSPRRKTSSTSNSAPGT